MVGVHFAFTLEASYMQYNVEEQDGIVRHIRSWGEEEKKDNQTTGVLNKEDQLFVRMYKDRLMHAIREAWKL